MWTRIWWVRPVSSSRRSKALLPYTSSTSYRVRASLPSGRTICSTREPGRGPRGASTTPAAGAGAYSAVTADQLFARSAQYQLTKRETEIARLICENKNSEEICGELVISTATLNKHLSNIYAKTNVKGRVQLYQLFSR